MHANLLIFFLYCASGFSALVFEVVLVRCLGHVLGASVLSAAAVTGLFLFGLAVGIMLGGWWAKRQGARSRRFWWRAFAVLAAAAGLLGANLPSALESSRLETLWQAISVTSSTGSYIVRLILATAVVLPIAGLMGAGFPVARKLIAGAMAAGSQWLYALNTTGAAVGAIVGGYLLLPQLGISGTACAAAAVSLCAGVACLWQGWNDRGQIDTNESALDFGSGGWGKMAAAELIALATLCGALAMLFEICCIRLIFLVGGSSTYSLSAVLSVYLLGSGAGALFAARWLERFKQPLLCAGCALTIASLAVVIAIYSIADLPWLFLACDKCLSSGNHQMLAGIGARLLTAAAFCFIPALALGVVLPMLFAAGREKCFGLPTAVVVLTANSCGCVLGSFLTGFIVIPQLARLCTSGIEAGLLVFCAFAALAAAWMLHAWFKEFIDDKDTCKIADCAVLFLLVACFADVALLRPEWNTAVMSSGAAFYSSEDLGRVDKSHFVQAQPSRNPMAARALLFYREGLNCTVTVEKNTRRNLIYLKTDGKTEAALPLSEALPSPNSDLATHKLLAALPISLHSGKCSDVLIIGFGTGATCTASLASPDVRKVSIAEIEPAVYSSSALFKNITADPIADARVCAVTNDGRYVLSSSASHYDVIICQPSDPWVNGASELFSREFFQLAASRLKQNGIVSQWLPLYELTPEYLGVLCRTFRAAFSYCALFRHPEAGECILLGSNSPLSKPPNIPPGSLWLNDQQFSHLCQLIGDKTGDFRLNTDDNLLVEFEAARHTLARRQGLAANLELLRSAEH